MLAEWRAAAMLTVEDPAFWEGVEPVKFGVLPRLQDSVTVIGYVCVQASCIRLRLAIVQHSRLLLSCAQLEIAISSVLFGRQTT